MTDTKFRIYGIIHNAVKVLLRRGQWTRHKIIGTKGINCNKITKKEAVALWYNFIENSIVPNPNMFKGFHYAGYILESRQWCLPSWIWTNAAIVRLYVKEGQLEKAKSLGANLEKMQQSCGGWIVRYDHDSRGDIPMLAPNDSAYIANNAFLSLYRATNEIKYLTIALRCADWIMTTCRFDSMVLTGYNIRDKKWDTNNIIVDVGFTAGLFADLFEITHEEKYKEYLIKFSKKYIELFFDPQAHLFATSIDKNDNRQGGFFARGQAWALEGLISAYRITSDECIREVIEKNISAILDCMNDDGSWPYVLNRKLMGNDCKGVSVIAKSLMEWYVITGDEKLANTVNKSLSWCVNHTLSEGKGRGGIYSYSTEGAIVKDFYTSCAFVYASAYAIELENLLKRYNLI